jgi:hypothetical protein
MIRCMMPMCSRVNEFYDGSNLTIEERLLYSDVCRKDSFSTACDTVSRIHFLGEGTNRPNFWSIMVAILACHLRCVFRFHGIIVYLNRRGCTYEEDDRKGVIAFRDGKGGSVSFEIDFNHGEDEAEVTLLRYRSMKSSVKERIMHELKEFMRMYCEWNNGRKNQ